MESNNQVEQLRNQRSVKFLDALHISIDDKWKKFLKEFGIDATENFKLAKDAGGMTPVGQPIDTILGKTLKPFCRNGYSACMLDYPVRKRCPVVLSRQLCTQWIVGCYSRNICEKVVEHGSAQTHGRRFTRG